MKDFLLIANKNCITYKEFFPFIKDRKVNIGYTHPGDFDQPEEDTHKSMQGLTRWFATLSTANKPPLVLTKTYDPEKYPKYDNYDAINVDRVKDIPYDYDGVIGCPITILDHNLDNVEIIGTEHYLQDGKSICQVDNRYGNQFATKDKSVYKRILIKKNFEIEGIWNDKREEADFIIKGTPTYVDEKHKNFQGPVVDGKAKYARVLIRRKHAFIPEVENNPQE